MLRLGVVADTHCPEFLDRLPPSLPRALQGVDLILHAGDVGGEGGGETLRELERIAPVVAVRGDHDAGLEALPTMREFLVSGCRIGLVHGNHGHLYEEPLTFLATITLGLVAPLPGHAGWLRAQFPNADLVVSGHTHRPMFDASARPVLFNPGAVYLVDKAAARLRLEQGPGWFEWTWLQVARHHIPRLRPTVGIVEVDGPRIQAHVVPLD
ncbi:MAG: YfcE family phosphodiesterase [Candidatus Dormibacteraeota bacterium]|nr:YfcE family phosphodiesterase [Candidatus Dormibacteraeota bacterium]